MQYYFIIALNILFIENWDHWDANKYTEENVTQNEPYCEDDDFNVSSCHYIVKL